MLRQLAFELFGQQPLGHLLAGADDTALEMGEERGRGRGIEAAALIVEQGERERSDSPWSPARSWRVVSQLATQRLARPGQAGLDRAHGTAEDGGDVGLGQPLEVEQDDHPRVLRERHQRRLDLGGHELAQAIELDVVAEPGRLRLDLGRDRVEAPDRRVAATTAGEAEPRVAQDAEQPGLEIGARLELPRRAQGPA